MPKIPLYPASVAPNEDDLLILEDSVTSNTKKIKRSDLLGGALITATNGLKSDTVVEKTAGAGVTADGVKMKDGLVVGGTGTGIANSSLDTTAGDIGGAWKDWTPSVTNFSGTLNFAKYTKIGKTVHFKVMYTMSGNDDVGNGPTFSLPVTAAAIGSYLLPIGQSMCRDVNSGYFLGTTHLVDTTAFQIYPTIVTGSYIGLGDVTAVAPFDWAIGDIILMTGTYEAA